MSCPIKYIPPAALYISGTGNRGGGFPLVPTCVAIAQPDAPVAEYCYLALEALSGTWSGTPLYIPLIQETQTTLVPDLTTNPSDCEQYMVSAPCVGAEFCYLAIEENGITNFELEETEDYFSVTCLI